MIMRSTVFLTLIFLGVASARRSIETTAIMGPSKVLPGLDLGQPYYPFGWGLDDSYFGVPEEFQIHEDGNELSEAMKEVKQEVAHATPNLMVSQQEHYPLPGWFEVGKDLQNKARGWFHSSHHTHVDEVEDALEGLE
ncbi:hypothetical protein MPSEU_001054900 [Mayamaea pseudoterrestris]|nr:hypothetical protein MPSEU_001054900 [Mayamaea pseudoterrestris]